ncbi:MAG: zinc metallopeptidase [Pirellulales bacterium]|nr:zinc metallopeptidase [Pirellulales bacterium]
MLLNFDPLYWIMLIPALLLGLWAQLRVKSAFSRAEKEPAPMSGAAAARYVLDSAGLQNVAIEPVQGFLSDHYDPRAKVLRLSPPVYQGRTMAAVGVAAHEAGHAIQDATGYLPLLARNAIVPLASFGGGISSLLLLLGFVFSSLMLIQVGIIAFSAVAFFQVVNLPVEFDASRRAKAQLDSLGVVARQDQTHVRGVLNAAAWTYVAGTLQAVLTLLYYVMRFTGGSSDE